MIAVSLGLGVAVGVVVGALGGGGAVLTVPLLVYVLGLTAQQATTGSLIIVGITAAVSSISHARSGHTRWRSGLLLAAAGVPASILGSRLNALVGEHVLLLAFAVLLVVAAGAMLRQSSQPGDGTAAASTDGAAASDAPVGRATSVETAPADAAADVRPRAQLLRYLLAGLVVGALTGFFGVGGGFVLVPVLVLALRLPMPQAVGTSLLVIALNAVVALLARLGHDSPDWSIVVPFTITAVAGALAGQQVADRLPSRTLSRAFAVLLVLVAGYVLVRTTGLLG